MNEIVIGIIVTLVLLGLGIGLFFILNHKKSPSNNWTDSQKNEVKTKIKSDFNGVGGNQLTDDQLNCIADKISSNMSYDDFKGADINSPTTLPNDKQCTDILIIGKSLSDCVDTINWDKLSDDQLEKLLNNLFAGGQSRARISFDPRCFANKMKTKYTLGEFLLAVAVSKAFQSTNPPTTPPPTINDFDKYFVSSATDCKKSGPTPVDPQDASNFVNYLSNIGLDSQIMNKILTKDPNCLVKSLMQLKPDDYFTLKNLFDRKSAPGLPNGPVIVIMLVYMKLLSNCIPIFQWRSLDPDDFIQGFPSVLQSKDMQCIALKFATTAPYNNYSFLEFVLLSGLIEFYSGTVSDFSKMPNILQDFYNNILSPLINDTSCDLKK
jgi:hypothetical protein